MKDEIKDSVVCFLLWWALCFEFVNTYNNTRSTKCKKKHDSKGYFHGHSHRAGNYGPPMQNFEGGFVILTQPFATAHTNQISQPTSLYYNTSSRNVCAQLGHSYRIPLNSETCFSVYYMSTNTFWTNPDHEGIINLIIMEIQLISSQNTQGSLCKKSKEDI